MNSSKFNFLLLKKNYFFKVIIFGVFIIIISPRNFGQKLPEWENKKELLGTNKDKISLVHFFATWCKPCMQELPIFDTLRTMYPKDKLEFTFICMDLKNSKKLKKTIMELKLPGDIYYFEPTQKSIQSTNPNWKGGLPASIIYLPNNREAVLVEGTKNVSFYQKNIEK